MAKWRKVWERNEHLSVGVIEARAYHCRKMKIGFLEVIAVDKRWSGLINPTPIERKAFLGAYTHTIESAIGAWEATIEEWKATALAVWVISEENNHEEK